MIPPERESGNVSDPFSSKTFPMDPRAPAPPSYERRAHALIPRRLTGASYGEAQQYHTIDYTWR